MESVIAVFRSRTETMSFANLMRSYNLKVYIINTPRRANVSCGISAQFSLGDLSSAESIVTRRHFMSFAGFYKTIVGANGEINVVPIRRS